MHLERFQVFQELCPGLDRFGKFIDIGPQTIGLKTQAHCPISTCLGEVRLEQAIGADKYAPDNKEKLSP
jgi:hypothetical protein